MSAPAIRINEKGQCPECLIKPIVYKRSRSKFCHRCCRAFDLDTGEQQNNWAWKRDVDGGFVEMKKPPLV